MSDLQIQLAVYEPDGPRKGLLPYPLALSATEVMNDLGAGSLDYLAAVQHSGFLESHCEIAIEVSTGPDTWEERGARWLRLKRGASIIDEAQTRRYALNSYGFMLGKIRMLRQDALNESGERVISGATPGTYLKTMIDEAKGRGNVPGLLYTFTSTHDSSGLAWDGPMPPFSLRYGDDLLASLRSLSEQGAFDWRVVGRELRVHKANTLGRDLSTAVVLHNGIDIQEAPDDEDGTEMAGRIGVQGDKGRTYAAISPFTGPWGLWEETVNASGISDLGGLQFIGEAEQRRRSAPRVQMTRKVLLSSTAYLPQLHYQVGDTIGAPDQSGEIAPLRVREVNLSLSRDGLGANLTLNDRILERDILDRRTITGLLGGASSSAGGSGIPSGGDEKRVPKAPIGFVVNSSHLFTPEGAAFAVIDAAWVPVTQGVDNLSIDVERHEVYARRNIAGEPWRKLTEVSGSDGRVTYSPLPVREVWQFKVRAVTRQSVVGEFSTALTVALAQDTEPPPPPSAPRLTTRLGVVTVAWDGLDAAGQLMPVDFERVDIWHTGTSSIVGTLRLSGGEDRLPITGLAYGVLQQFRLVAVDRAGNASTASAPASITPLQVEGADILAGTVDTVHLKADAIDATRIQADAITAKHTITGATIRTAANGARTEMTGAGLRTVDAANNDLVRIGHGIPTGMGVRDPISGVMTPLAPHVFGTKASSQDNATTGGLNPPVNGGFVGPAYFDIGTFTSTTGRFLITMSVEQAFASYQNGSIAINTAWYDPSGKDVAAGVTTTFNVGGYGPATISRVLNFTPGMTYTVKWVWFARRFLGSDGPPSLGPRTLVVMPI